MDSHIAQSSTSRCGFGVKGASTFSVSLLRDYRSPVADLCGRPVRAAGGIIVGLTGWFTFALGRPARQAAISASLF